MENMGLQAKECVLEAVTENGFARTRDVLNSTTCKMQALLCTHNNERGNYSVSPLQEPASMLHQTYQSGRDMRPKEATPQFPK